MLLISDSGIDSFAQFLTVFALFIIVVFITYFTTRYVAGVQRFRFKGKNIEVIEAQRISPNINIQILRIGNRYYAVTVGRDNVTCIGEVPKEDITLLEDAQIAPINFQSILEKVRSRERKK